MSVPALVQEARRLCWMEAGAPLPMLKGGGTHGDLGGSGFGHQSQVPPSLIRPPAGLGRCFQGGIAVKSQGVTQQQDISRRSISSTMNQSYKQPTKQPPSRASPAWAGAAPGMVPPSVSRRWGGCRGHGEHPPQFIGGLCGEGTPQEAMPEQNAAARRFCRRKCR